jgi:hypothetical protein
MTAGRLKAQIVLCVIGIFDLPTFRELGPAVPVETAEDRCRLRIFYSFIDAGSSPDRQDDER